MRSGFFFLLFSTLLLSFAGTQEVYAQATAAGVEIKPAVIEERGEPGTSIDKTILIKNVSETPQTFYFYVRDVSGVDDGGRPTFADAGSEVTGYEISSWVTIPKDPLLLQPQESIEVPIRITVPQDASPKSHFGGISVSVQPPQTRELGASIGYDVYSLLSVRVAGEAFESARIREFSTDKHIYSETDVDFTLRIENPGNVLVRPRGFVHVKNMFNKQVASISVNEGGAGVIPESMRVFSFSWEEDGLSFGRYQATIGLVYGEDAAKRSVTGSVSFWILPVKIIVPVLAVFSLVVLVVYLGVKLYIRKALDEIATTQGRRVVRRRKDAGVSKLLLITVTLLIATTLFLILLLVVFA